MKIKFDFFNDMDSLPYVFLGMIVLAVLVMAVV